MRFAKSTFFTAVLPLLVSFSLMLLPVVGHAQTSSDTTARSDTSSAPQRASDSLMSQGVDSSRGTKPDTGAAAQRPASPAPPSPPPVDSAFAAACNPPPPATPAASLLLVTLSPTLTERERREIAKRVRGTWAGVASTGEQYLRVSGAGSTRTAADSLILYQGVKQVSERPCPVVVPSGR